MANAFTSGLLRTPQTDAQGNLTRPWVLFYQGLGSGSGAGGSYDYNVKTDYNAAGDGVTDDTPAISAAITAVSAAGGGRLFFPAGTYLIRPVTTTQILPIASNIWLQGAGAGVTVLKVADGSGSYDSILGPKFSVVSNIAITDLTIDQNDTGNPQSSGSDALAHSRFLLSTAKPSGALLMDRVECTNLNNINLIQSNSTPTIVTHCRFTNIGGGSVYHDHSTLYIQCEGAVVADNVFQSRAVSAAGAVTAIEMHGGRQTITGNVIDGMQIGMNITGVRSNSATTPQTANVVVSGNTITAGYYGIFFWSQIPTWSGATPYVTGDIVLETGVAYVATSGSTNSAPHLLAHWAVKAWTGLADVVCADNAIRLTQTAWTTNAGGGTSPMLGNPIGITIYIASNVPCRNIKFSDNVVEFDPEPNNTYPWDSSGYGIGYWDSTNLNTVDGFTIAGNTVRNAPGPGIRFASNGTHIEIRDNQIINCGSTLKAGATASFRAGIFLASLAQIPGLRILGNSIVDDYATTRMVYGIELATSNVGDIECRNNTIAVTGATATAFLGAWNTAVAGQVALIQDTIFAPNAATPLPIGGLVALDSTVRDLSAAVTYRVRANGNTWNRHVVTSSAAPAAGAWIIGDYSLNDSPSGAQPIVGWTCIAGGTPGTWVPLTALDMTGPITMANNKVFGFRNAANSGTLVGMLANAADDLEIGAGGTAHKTVIKTGFAVSANDVTAAAGEISIGNLTGVGNGAAVAVGTVQKGTGTGPTTPGSIASFLRINIGGTTAWIPWFL